MSEFDLNKFKTRPAGQFIREDGTRIELNERIKDPPKRRGTFPTRFIQLPEFWAGELEKLKSATTWHLARRILRAAYIQKHTRYPEPVILSKKMTGLARTSRYRAANNLVRRGLIHIRQEGHRAAIVTELQLGEGKTVRLYED
jgi:hypothetical protein